MDIHTDSGTFTVHGASAVVPLSTSDYLITGTSWKLSHPWGATEYYRHGWNSWTPTRWWTLRREPWRIWDKPLRALTADDAATDTPTEHHSSMVTALSGPEGRTLLIGAVHASSPLLRISAEEVVASAEAEEASWLVTIGSEPEVFARYAGVLKEEYLGERSPLRAAETLGPVWSSWYSWFEEITAEIIAAEIKPARELGYGTIQIDDGWERRVGDWRANSKFSAGMAEVFSRIHDEGLKAGLWVAPFITLPDTPVLSSYPELFLRDTDGSLTITGNNWGANYYALDFSKPQAHDWLASTMSTIRDWGVDMFKLDFIYAAAIAGERAGGMPREEAYRSGLETIRAAVGDDVYLLGSGAVINASFGVLDGVRVGPDTAPYWDNTERVRDPSGPAVVNALRNSLSRTWLKPLLDCDPDVAYFRTRGSLLSPEVNALTADAALACEFAQCSCPAAWLSEEEKAAVRAWTTRFRGAPVVRQLGRYRFEINGEVIDFDPYLNPSTRISDRLLVK
ncbi:alpha-galactosidase [Actinotignum sanguinis]|uniref:glycoside hydrolase family 36 protein n=1 Tax=Actinotignum sanguinis TaxID=1445614 RepID=UPI000F7D61D4|nr:glycoside hydrolase family 36 protein [Actinotignum sanguinis]MDY5148898.1 alpha-galactosidase [Actinotignum sanguinis]RTE49397.1 alpha-galactosidase [Actinotignum sanguinis]